MCNFRLIPLCHYCRQPLPPVTMAHTAAGIAPVHICQPQTNAAAAAPDFFPLSLPAAGPGQSFIIPPILAP